MQNKPKNILLKIAVGAGSFVMWLLSFKAVRRWIWNKVEKTGKEKIVDAKAKIVDEKEGEKFLS